MENKATVTVDYELFRAMEKEIEAIKNQKCYISNLTTDRLGIMSSGNYLRFIDIDTLKLVEKCNSMYDNYYSQMESRDKKIRELHDTIDSLKKTINVINEENVQLHKKIKTKNGFFS